MIWKAVVGDTEEKRKRIVRKLMRSTLDTEVVIESMEKRKGEGGRLSNYGVKEMKDKEQLVRKSKKCGIDGR